MWWVRVHARNPPPPGGGFRASPHLGVRRLETPPEGGGVSRIPAHPPDEPSLATCCVIATMILLTPPSVVCRRGDERLLSSPLWDVGEVFTIHPALPLWYVGELGTAPPHPSVVCLRSYNLTTPSPSVVRRRDNGSIEYSTNITTDMSKEPNTNSMYEMVRTHTHSPNQMK